MQFRLECHEALESTSTTLKQRAEAGEAEGLAILALRQSAGRGRQGRGWDSPAGNLYLSLLLRPAVPLREAPQWSFVAAVQGGFWTLAVVGVLTSVISAFYYLRVVKVMYFDEAQAPLDARPQTLTMVMAISGIFTTLFFLMPAPLVRAAQEAVSALLG